MVIMRRRILCVALTSLTLGLNIQTSLAGGMLLASGFNSDQVHRYDAATGAYLGGLGPGGDLNGPLGVTVGPDGKLYVACEESNRILRYDRQTFAYIDTFIFDDPGTPGDETGGLNGPTTAVFGPDGNVYVASFDNDSVRRYNGTTGAFIDVFVPTGSNLLNGPDAGMIFGADGNLYIPSYFSHRVLRFNGTTGAFIDTFITNGGITAASLRNPRTVLFRYGCNDLLINNEQNSRVQRYNATTGAYIDRIIPVVSAPTGMAIGADGNIYVASITDSSIIKFSGQDGSNLGTFVTAGSGGLNGVVFLRFLPLSGDANCDGLVTMADLDGFVQLLIDPVGYAISHPNCDAMNADITDDGAADGLDISAFVRLVLCN